MKILKSTIKRNPRVCPPNKMLPPEVPSPIGKVVCDPKSRTVVKKGNMLTPTKAAEIPINQKELVSKPINIKHKDRKVPTKNILHLSLY